MLFSKEKKQPADKKHAAGKKRPAARAGAARPAAAAPVQTSSPAADRPSRRRHSRSPKPRPRQAKALRYTSRTQRARAPALPQSQGRKHPGRLPQGRAVGHLLHLASAALRVPGMPSISPTARQTREQKQRKSWISSRTFRNFSPPKIPF